MSEMRGPHLGGGGRVVESRGRTEDRSEEEEEEERLDSIGGVFVSCLLGSAVALCCFLMLFCIAVAIIQSFEF